MWELNVPENCMFCDVPGFLRIWSNVDGNMCWRWLFDGSEVKF